MLAVLLEQVAQTSETEVNQAHVVFIVPGLEPVRQFLGHHHAVAVDRALSFVDEDTDRAACRDQRVHPFAEGIFVAAIPSWITEPSEHLHANRFDRGAFRHNELEQRDVVRRHDRIGWLVNQTAIGNGLVFPGQLLAQRRLSDPGRAAHLQQGASSSQS